MQLLTQLSSTKLNAETAFNFVEYLKFSWNSALIVFSLFIIFSGLSLNYGNITVFPLVSFAILGFAIVLLACAEGLHYGVVSFEKWDMSQYESRFPRACKIHKLTSSSGK